MYICGSPGCAGMDGGTSIGSLSRGSGVEAVTFGFTDGTNTTGAYIAQTAGADDYQDGWSCGDAWTPLSVRGERALVMVR